MNKATLFGGGVLVMALVVGCGGGSPEDRVARQQIDLFNEMATIMEGVQDAESFKAAQAKINGLETKAKDIAKETEKWSQQTKDDMKKKYEGEAKKAFERFTNAMKSAAVKASGGAIKITP
jgi:hypothetical protein